MKDNLFFDDLTNFVAKHEGCSSLVKGKNKYFSKNVPDGTLIYPYLDITGTPTIGFGNTYYTDFCKVGINDAPITYKGAKRMLSTYLEKLVKQVDSYLTVELSENQKIALCSLLYNVGRVKSIVYIVNNIYNDKTKVEFLFRGYVYSKGKKLKGLVNRREDELKKYFL